MMQSIDVEPANKNENAIKCINNFSTVLSSKKQYYFFLLFDDLFIILIFFDSFLLAQNAQFNQFV
jgi:hypothetical protein